MPPSLHCAMCQMRCYGELLRFSRSIQLAAFGVAENLNYKVLVQG